METRLSGKIGRCGVSFDRENRWLGVSVQRPAGPHEQDRRNSRRAAGVHRRHPDAAPRRDTSSVSLTIRHSGRLWDHRGRIVFLDGSPMNTTRYFEHTRKRPDRRDIRDEWILSAVRDPLEEVLQADGRIRRWVWVEEKRSFLRVILLEDGETVHNAFFDRGYPGEERK